MKFRSFLLYTALAVFLVAGLFAIGATFGAKVAIVAYLAGNALCSPLMSQCLGDNAWTKLGDLWVPEIVSEGMREPLVERSAFLDSGVVATSAELVAAASGPGTDITVNMILEPSHDDQQQQEDTAPEIKKLSSGTQRVTIMNRVNTLGSTALAQAISGVSAQGDLLSVVLDCIKSLRKLNRGRVVAKSLSGLFDVTAAPAANTGAFKALRKDAFIEDGNAAVPATHFIDSDKIIDAIGLSGQNKAHFTGGAICMHSKIEGALNKQGSIDVIRDADGNIVLRSYKGLTVIMDDTLVRNGGTSGQVYYTFICGLKSIAMGDKPQIVTDLAGEVASLSLDLRDVAKNNVAVYDRTRFILHPQGAKWSPQNGVPVITEAGPSNTELADDANWALGAQDVRNVRIVCLRTNG